MLETRILHIKSLAHSLNTNSTETKKYKILDLFCCSGGAGQGYMDSGFEVTGIDIKNVTNYPGKFIQAPALFYLRRNGHLYDAIHASPPCQKYSKSTAQFRKQGKQYADLIDKTRKILKLTGKPFIIENVPSAPIRADIKLCGSMFNLKVLKERFFEIENCFIMQIGIPHKIDSVRNGDFAQVVGKGQKKGQNKLDKPFKFDGPFIEQWKFAMGIDWMNKAEQLAEAMPPAYTNYIGTHLINYLNFINNK